MAYFDAASAEPLHPVARETYLAALDQGWADPARLHAEGRRAALLLEHARESVAAVLGAYADELSFPASGTQAAHLAVLGGLAGRRRAGRGLVVSAVEHSAVLAAGAADAGAGGSLTHVPVDRTGRVEVSAYVDALTAGTALAALQSANHEVGTRQPVAEVAAACAERGIPLYVDAAASVGREPVPGGWSLLSASAHKWGGPPGVGVLVVRRGTRWRSPLPADEREGGRVPGAPNLPGILAAATALEAVAAQGPAESARLRILVDHIRSAVPRLVLDCEVVGHPSDRLPHVVTFSCLYLDGEAVVTELSRAGHAVSSGSACTSSTLEPSHVLTAMGVLTHGNVRVSLPLGTTRADVDAFLADLPDVVARLRRLGGADPGGRAGAEVDADVVIDAVGRRCPVPVIELARRIAGVPVGAVAAVLADDPAARHDVPAWAGMRGHDYLGERPAGGATAYLVRRRGETTDSAGPERASSPDSPQRASSNAAGSGSESARSSRRR